MDSLENGFPGTFEDTLLQGKSLTAEEYCVHLRAVQRLAIYTYTYRRGVSSSHRGQIHSVRRTGHESAPREPSIRCRQWWLLT